MPCYTPLKAYRSRTDKTRTGKQKIYFGDSPDTEQDNLELPCGQCVGCRQERTRQWAIRCVHEASLHEQNCFLTLTISSEQPEEKQKTLNKRDFQLFMKKLRKKFPNNKILYLYCGEYGEKFSRPHYHACIFGLDFPDKEIWKQTDGQKLYTSEILNKLWGYGYCIIGDVTFQSAAYVASYINKKITGSEASEHYKGKVPEYANMSRRPAIAKNWIEKYISDTYPHDDIVLSGKKHNVPRYYDKQLEKLNPKLYEQIKLRRAEKLEKFIQSPENSDKRKTTKYEYKLEIMKNGKRSFEETAPEDIFALDFKKLQYKKGENYDR